MQECQPRWGHRTRNAVRAGRAHGVPIFWCGPATTGTIVLLIPGSHAPQTAGTPTTVGRRHWLGTMTINVLRGRAARNSGTADPVESLPIGEVDSAITSCPNCARPLAVGARRCPGCGSRLLLGVQLARATVFVMVGIAGGLLAGGVLASVIYSSGVVTTPAPVPVASTAPIASGAPLPQPSAKPAPSSAPAQSIPTASLSALRQMAALNARLLAGAALLQTEVDSNAFDAPSAARILRVLASDLAIGIDTAPRIDRWHEAGDLGARLRALYADASTAARSGLGASLSNEAAYRAASERMIAVLGGITSLADESRVLADRAGISLPTVGS